MGTPPLLSLLDLEDEFEEVAMRRNPHQSFKSNGCKEGLNRPNYRKQRRKVVAKAHKR